MAQTTDNKLVHLHDIETCLTTISEKINDIREQIDGLEAPNDGKYYVRGYGTWNEVVGANVIKTYTTKYKLQNNSGTQIDEVTLTDIL